MSRIFKERLLRPDTLVAMVVLLTAAGLLLPTAELRAASAFLPATMLIGLMALALIMLVLDQRQASAGKAAQALTDSPNRVAAAFLLIVLYVVSVDFLGFYLSTAVSVPAVAFAFGYRSRAGLTLATLVVLAAVYLIFDFAMAQEFPTGRLWSW